MVIETHLNLRMGIKNQNTPISNMVNIKIRGTIRYQITLMSLLSHMTEMDQITK